MPKEPTKDTKATKQQTLLGFFGKPKIGSNVHSSSPSASSSTQNSSPASVARPRPRGGLPAASSPLTVVASIDNVTIIDEEDVAPPSSPTKGKGRDQLAMPMIVNEDDDEDEFPVSTTRRAKRRPVYVDSDSDDDTAHASSSASKPSAARKKSKVVKDEDDDDFVMNDDDEIKMQAEIAASAAAFNAASPMELDSDVEADFMSDDSAPKAKAKPKARASLKASKPASRPSAKPLANGDGNSASASGSNQFLTQAEIRKLDAKQEKKDAEDCFEFLKDIRDKDGVRKGEPGYDERTIFIPKKAWEKFTPFEHQFWEIKQDHYDTVLFFQKGKFYELYEDDAMIGHTEFDLKLTDRVKMKMVGVPEMSFEMWAAKFLAAGYKVGKVEQAETAIGMSMRQKDDKEQGKPPAAGKKGDIVRRELRNVFTNGTIVDSTFLTSDEANHCVAIKELTENPNMPSSFGICVLDASTGEFNMAAFEDDACRTRLETMFRQIRPKELVHAKGNLSVLTLRLLRNILPMSTIWSSLKPGTEFLDADVALAELETFFPSKDDIPTAITDMADKPLALEALGGLMTYLKSLNLDKDLITQKNFNVYDPIRQGQSLVLDGQTLGHIEVLVNSEGGDEGTLLKMLQRCVTPFGKRLFRIWLTMPLRKVAAINDRLDAVEDLMSHASFSGDFSRFAKGLPDLERLVSRIHAGSCKQKDFRSVLESFETMQKAFIGLLKTAENFESASVSGLLRSAPDLAKHLAHVKGMFKIENDAIVPELGANSVCDDAIAAVAAVEEELDDLLVGYKKQFKSKADYWHSAQGTKEVYHLQLAAGSSVPKSWVKVGSTKAFARYTTPETLPLIRKVQEVRETRTVAFRNFYRTLMSEFDADREVWLKSVRVFAELDCLLSLAKASNDLDEPKCRPEFVEADSAFVDFEDLRHPAMCVRSDFIANNVQLGGEAQRTVLLTGPNCAGKSTLMRMTAAGVILAQLGCFVPASRAKLSPIDKIQTRMGAYDNMFASASTFKVELDECSKILREAGPSSLVILDELGRGTSTFDGMAIASAVLHHLATHTLPLGFFATHYGSLTDDFTYHPNIRNMHMQTHVDDGKRDVTFLYKLIDGKAKSSYGTHVAYLAGFPTKIVERAEVVSHDFFEAFKQKQAQRRRSDLPLVAQADFKWLMGRLAGVADESAKEQMKMIRRSVPTYHEAC